MTRLHEETSGWLDSGFDRRLARALSVNDLV